MVVCVNSIPALPALAFASKCRTQIEINQMHANLITTGQLKNPCLTTKIILDFATSKHKPLVNFARYLFFTQNCKDPFIWNLIIKSYSHGNDPDNAFQLFALMLLNGVLVDEYSFSLVLKSCSRMNLVKQGMQIHGLLSKYEFGLDVFLQNGLICMYIKCGCIQFGRLVFERLHQKDSFTYNLMIDGYVKCGMVDLARELFDSMPLDMKNLISWNTLISGYVKLENGFEVASDLFEKMPERDLISWNLMIDCCVKKGKLELASLLFDKMPERDVISWATMVDGYAKTGNVDVARGFFDSMPQRDVISCNAMMVGYVKSGRCKEALKVFHDMLSGGCFDLAPDNVTLLTALSAIAQLGCIEEGVAMHCYMEGHGFVVSGKLGVALIDMYAKCGSIEWAMNVFEDVEKKGIDHWNTIIGGLAIHGLGDLAFGFFMEMERLHLEPDDITFIAVMNACGHAGLVKEGVLCFEIMRRFHKMEPKLQHYGCMVDILARAGHMEEATRFVKEMPIEPNDVVWRTLLSACTNHEKLSIGEPVAKHLIEIDSYNPSSYILLSNMYAQFGLWDYVRQVRTIMKERDLKKVPGCSWIVLEGTVHEFFVGDKSNRPVREDSRHLDQSSPFVGFDEVFSSCSESSTSFFPLSRVQCTQKLIDREGEASKCM